MTEPNNSAIPQGCQNCGHTQQCYAIGGNFVRPDQTCISWTPLMKGQSSKGMLPPEEDSRCCGNCRDWYFNGALGVCKALSSTKTSNTESAYRCALWVKGD